MTIDIDIDLAPDYRKRGEVDQPHAERCVEHVFT